MDIIGSTPDSQTPQDFQPMPMPMFQQAEAQEQPQEPMDRVPDDLVGVQATVDDEARLRSLQELASNAATKHNVVVSEEQKNNFVNSIVTGDRYTEDFDLFGGAVRIKVRCRALQETDAILAYLRHAVALGAIKSDHEYTARLRELMLVFQVASINDVVYPEVQGQLFFSEQGGKLIAPSWESELKTWQKKPEALIAAISLAITEFEARYYKMIEESSNINFWRPGGSTGN